VIRGQLEVLAAQQDPLAEEVRRVEGLVRGEIARMDRLIDDLLLLAKTEQTEFLRIESIDLPVYVADLWDGMSLLASRRFELGPVPGGTLRADPDRLAQALRNLVGNAIEHTAPGDGLVRMGVGTSKRGDYAAPLAKAYAGLAAPFTRRGGSTTTATIIRPTNGSTRDVREPL
jgi:signal transduction histidine kinase